MKKGQHVVCIARSWHNHLSNIIMPSGCCPSHNCIYPVDKVIGESIMIKDYPDQLWHKSGFAPLDFKKQPVSKTLALTIIKKSPIEQIL